MAKSISIGSVQIHSASFTIAKQVEQQNLPCLVLTPNSATADRLKRELAFFLPEVSVDRFPDWETLPFDQFSPHQDIRSERLRLLHRLPHLQKGVILASVETLMHRLPPPSFLAAQVLLWKIGDVLDVIKYSLLLEQAGYSRVNQVLTRGEFSLRGSILDIFPMGAKAPIRVELFDNEISTLRYFDLETQRSQTPIESIEILPAFEHPLDDAAIRRFELQWKKHFSDRTFKSPLLEAIKQRRTFGGVEYYLPLFFEESAYLFDYLPESAQVIQVFNTYKQAEHFWTEIEDRHRLYQHDLDRPALPPVEVFFHPAQVFTRSKAFLEIKLLEKPLPHSPNQFNEEALVLPELHFDAHQPEPLAKLRKFLKESSQKILFCAESAGRREVLMEHLGREGISVVPVQSFSEFLKSSEKFQITLSPLEDSLAPRGAGFILLTERTVFSQFVPQFRRRQSEKIPSGTLIRDLGDLKIQDAVVHIEHGIGRYLGLETLDLGSVQSECFVIEYAGGDKLFVPIQDLHLITRYSGTDLDLAPISKLGTDRWEKDKEKAAKKAYDVAAELLEIYAKRESKKGFSYERPGEDFSRFCADFPFEETPDQLSAIAAIIDDMHADKPMDRLLCGDVGFGKTEVAMRATFIAVHQKKQVAVLVPTTLLAQQHYESFSDRFAEWPVSIEMISRFRTTAEQEMILKKLAQGKIDILIGTHKILSSDVQFKNLGLLVVDEEHRFGVRDKERMKALRAEVDILTLTATPIPRTLNLAFSQLRDLSLIATPPAKRLSVKTFVKEFSNAILKEAISREIHRGGQVYYLYNDVSRIDARKEELQALFPDLKIAIGHGQMRERDLEKVMADFYHHHSHILLCSTIIETGIDLPNANTILIERADRFGLAQLHQLRGRVGRSHHQAYAYLLIPPENCLTEDAKKRLEAIQQASELGAGFALASQDLEIRGAGELLGDEQSGQIQRIGFNLYLELLERTVQAIKSGKILKLDEAYTQNHVSVDLGLSALIPNPYLSDVSLRLSFYKRIAEARDEKALENIKVELIDRFGLLPEPTQALFHAAHLRLEAQALGILSIKASAKYFALEFSPHQSVKPEKIIHLIQRYPSSYKLRPPATLLISLEMNEPLEKRLEILKKALGMLRN